MRALIIAVIAVVLAACQANPTTTGGSGANSKQAQGSYPSGLKRYEVGAELKQPKMNMAQTAAAKEAADRARNQERNKRLSSDTARAALHFKEQEGLFVWKHRFGEFSGKALNPREDLNIPGGNGYKLAVDGKFNRWKVNVLLRSIDFGVLTDRSHMIVAHINKGGDHDKLQPSLKLWDKALTTCRSTLPYVFGDLYLVLETTNPLVAALQVCLYEETKGDQFLSAFMKGGHALDDFVGNNGLDITLNEASSMY